MKYKIVYVLAPSNYVTGGVEAMFQLCDAINTVEIDITQGPMPSKHSKH